MLVFNKVMALDDYRDGDPEKEDNPLREEPPSDCDSWIEAEPGETIIVGEKDNSLNSKETTEDGRKQLVIYEQAHAEAMVSSSVFFQLDKRR